MTEEVSIAEEEKPSIRLTEVSSGTICRLVGISKEIQHQGQEKSHPGQRRRHRRREKRNGVLRSHKEKGHRGVMRRLLDLGLTKGCTFEVIHGGKRGPVLVQIRGTRIALGHGLASKILVEEVDSTG
ncbi:MAG: FeoA family protein [Candidatus Thorarchaeota archaeon]|jgi:ferrous iron transport protein A